VVVGDQGSLDGCADEPVVPDDRVEGELSLDDAGPKAGADSAAVALEAELALQRPDDGLDALAEPVRDRARCLLVLTGRADQGQISTSTSRTRQDNEALDGALTRSSSAPRSPAW
jgi:hypothetical protein